MKKALFLFAMAIAASGCNEPLPEASPATSDQQLEIRLALNTTRANDSTYEIGDQVGLYVVNVDENEGQLTSDKNHVNNMRYTLGDQGWTPDETSYWRDHMTFADFYVYYPYRESVADVKAMPIEVATDQSSEELYWASDFLWGMSSDEAPRESAVEIATKHLLSNLLIDVTPGLYISSEEWESAEITITINNTITSGTVDLESGVITAGETRSDITPWNTGDYYRALILPQTVTEDTTLVTVTINGTPYTIGRNITFKANTQHKLTVRIDNNPQTGISLTIDPWEVDPTEYGITNKEIWYTTSDGQPVELPIDQSTCFIGFGPLVSNTYMDDRGVIICWEEITSIPISCFEGSNISSILLPNSLEDIGEAAFANCKNLTEITIPDNVTTIAIYPFAGCSNLVRFNGKFASPDGLALICDEELLAYAIGNTQTTYTIPNNVTSIGAYAFEMSLLTTITIPGSVKSIGYNAFCNCQQLSSLSLREGVEQIFQSAFQGCSTLTAVTIPSTVTQIQALAFCSCESLSSIVCKATTPPTATLLNGSWRAFDNDLEDQKIYVPAESVEAYKEAEGWSEYADRIEAIPAN